MTLNSYIKFWLLVTLSVWNNSTWWFTIRIGTHGGVAAWPFQFTSRANLAWVCSV